MINFYKILGVKNFATSEEIKVAYRKLSKKFHPDLNDGDKFFEEKFKELQNAYETLSDSHRKEIYDKKLENFYTSFENVKGENKTENREAKKQDEPRNQSQQKTYNKKESENKKAETYSNQRTERNENITPIVLAYAVFFILIILVGIIGSSTNDNNEIENKSSSYSKNNQQYFNQNTIAKFTITNGKDDNEDISNFLLAQDAFIVFYINENDKLIYMANVWPRNNSQSYGPLYNLKQNKQETTYERYHADIYSFNWRYSNDYNDKTGIAKVQIIKISKPQGITYSVKIILEDDRVLEYKGNMDNIVDFSKFD